ncbi:MAG: GNAT family protein [bacterium]
MQIKFRLHKRSDILYRVKWFNNSKVNRYVCDLSNPKTTLKKETKWFNDYQKDKNKIFFTILDGKIPIGCIGLSNINKQNKNAEAFIIIGEDDYRGKGVGKLAMQYLINYGFSNLKLHKITLGVSVNNKPAVKCYKSVGFIKEGVLKDDEFYNGKYSDLILMAVFNNLKG